MLCCSRKYYITYNLSFVFILKECVFFFVSACVTAEVEMAAVSSAILEKGTELTAAATNILGGSEYSIAGSWYVTCQTQL